jgi:hypothetical protein
MRPWALCGTSPGAALRLRVCHRQTGSYPEIPVKSGLSVQGRHRLAVKVPEAIRATASNQHGNIAG